jgi:hypothetical protein
MLQTNHQSKSFDSVVAVEEVEVLQASIHAGSIAQVVVAVIEPNVLPLFVINEAMFFAP